MFLLLGLGIYYLSSLPTLFEEKGLGSRCSVLESFSPSVCRRTTSRRAWGEVWTCRLQPRLLPLGRESSIRRLEANYTESWLLPRLNVASGAIRPRATPPYASECYPLTIPDGPLCPPIAHERGNDTSKRGMRLQHGRRARRRRHFLVMHPWTASEESFPSPPPLLVLPPPPSVLLPLAASGRHPWCACASSGAGAGASSLALVLVCRWRWRCCAVGACGRRRRRRRC
mmetsp:Transcript_26344/g.63516  ORF Transcript_26344/g.63516 Transcript_26344/m.63516 type:complete len:228 (+) Transcript_26344:545-1228(+)